MANMTRRDYLRLIAASAAGLAIGDSCAKPTQHDVRLGASSLQTPIPKPEKPRIWTKRSSNPFPQLRPDETVKLIFFGLGGLVPKGDTCDVGFHSSGDVSHRHTLSVYAFENAIPNGCREVYNSTNPREQIAKIELKVDKPNNQFKEVQYFQPGEVQTRRQLSNDRDFRWVIDFESDYLYRNFPGAANAEKLRKVPHIYKPVLNVPSGLLYTLRRTGSYFEAKTSSGAYRSDLGHVADVIGANVYVDAGTRVSLIINSNPTPHRIQAPAEIYFINSCTKNAAGDHCDADPSSSDKTKRGDFYLHYKGFELQGMPEYELFLLNEPAAQPTQPEAVCNVELLRPHISLTDESPCAVVGYGGGY